MLYSFLSESGVLDISLLALSTGIIVLSILGLLHLGKRRGHNKAGHFSEQPDDCAMPAVQTENSDGWPSMEQPQTTELVSVVAAPEDSSNLDSPPSETVVSEKQDVKPECVPVPDIRWRRSMTLPDYKKTFLVRVDYDLRASLHVSAPTKRKILEVLKKIGGERLTATSYVDNILRHHLEMFRDEINCIHQEQNYHNIV